MTGGESMNIGISTACLYPMETEKALELLINNHVSLFEIFFNTISEIQPDFIKNLKNIVTSSGGRVKSVHPFTSGYEPYLLFTNYERRYKDTLEFYKNYFNAAGELGAEIVVIHGDRKTSETGGISNKEYFDKFGELSEIGKSFGITLAQENVNAFRSHSPKFLREMKEYLGDRAKFVLDIKQGVRSGHDPLEVCDAMGDGVVHLHINDNNNGSDCLLPGYGETSYEQLFNVMKKHHYSGDAVIEVYRSSYGDIHELVQSYDYLKGIGF